MTNTIKEKRFYGRKSGRPLNKSRQDAMETLLPALSIPQDILTEQGDLKPSTLFKPSLHGLSVQSSRTKMDHPNKSGDDDFPKEIWFEIGFGTGEHLSALMRRHADFGFLGAEPYSNGMAAFLKDVSESPPQCHSGEYPLGHKSRNLMDLQKTDPGLRRDDINVRVIMEDAMFLANSLADHSLDGMYVLNPDPWHKKRHYKRRMIRRKNLDCFARILKPGAPLIMSTDVPDLADWMVSETSMHPAFEWDAMRARDWRDVPDGWIHTAYESKNAKGADKMVYLMFRSS